MSSSHDRTVQEWQVRVGEQIRAARLARDVDQARLAELANLSVFAISSLENGKGSSLSSLIAVVRALDLTDWLDHLAPTSTVSPRLVFESQGRARVRRRAAARRDS
jgi:transcriptional regulator with XRE-family HTH domain